MRRYLTSELLMNNCPNDHLLRRRCRRGAGQRWFNTNFLRYLVKLAKYITSDTIHQL